MYLHYGIILNLEMLALLTLVHFVEMGSSIA